MKKENSGVQLMARAIKSLPKGSQIQSAKGYINCNGNRMEVIHTFRQTTCHSIFQQVEGGRA